MRIACVGNVPTYTTRYCGSRPETPLNAREAAPEVAEQFTALNPISPPHGFLNILTSHRLARYARESWA